MSWRLPVAGTMALALAACGHGGSHGSSSGITVPFQPASTPAVYAAPGSGLANLVPGGPSSASAVFTAGAGVTGSGQAPADTAGNTVTLTTDSARNIFTIAINIAAPGGTGPALLQTFTATQQGGAILTAAQFAALVAQIAASPVSIANAVYQGSVAGLANSAYGAWMQSAGGGSYNVGVYSFGPETLAAAMPTMGTATYNGTTLGFGANGTAPFTFTAAAQVSANFATHAITNLQFTGFATQDVNDALAGPAISTVVGAGAIAGNKYGFAVNGTVTPTGGAATAVTGTVNGLFYGANAIETGGTWKASNLANTITLIGGFGAHP
jgi:hypothetical protein